jgi:hypothetical protein
MSSLVGVVPALGAESQRSPHTLWPLLLLLVLLMVAAPMAFLLAGKRGR